MQTARKCAKIRVDTCNLCSLIINKVFCANRFKKCLADKTTTLMHKINPQSLVSQSLFGLPLDRLTPEDHPKRVILDKLPWDELAVIAKKAYASDYWKDKPNARVMIGLFVWHCISGDRTYREIADDFSLNNMCAYACGFKNVEFREIDHTTLIKFEEHLGEENILKIKDIIENRSVKKQAPNSKGRHSGDTTVFESNIAYPTDTKIMETVRLFLVNDIIKPCQNEVNQSHRTYSRVARAEYLNFAKKRIANKAQIKKIKKKQLQFLKRNLSQAKQIIAALQKGIDNNTGDSLPYWMEGVIPGKKSANLFGETTAVELRGKANKGAFRRLRTKLKTAELIYAQQLAHYHGKKIDNRIVSFHRPKVRPIFRGKARKTTEFGVKVFLSIMGKALILSKTSYNNFYDGHGFVKAITDMRNKKYSVKEVIGDKGNGGICKFLKNHNIINGIERRGKRIKPPPIPRKRFARARNGMEGAIGTVKNVFIKNGLRAKTDFGDLKKICKAAIGFNLTYAF